MTDTDRFGPQTEAIEALLARVRAMTPEEVERVTAARNAAWYATRDPARYVARNAAWYATRDATRDTARYAVWDAVLALLVRDLIDPDTDWTQERYDTLTAPLASVIGKIHPDDREN